MWPVIITCTLLAAIFIFNVAEAIYDLDRWIAEREKREREGYDYENDRFYEKPQPKPEPVKILTPEPVKKPTLELENFPKSAEDAKAKIERLLKNAKNNA
jgi:hypothetical protein